MHAECVSADLSADWFVSHCVTIIYWHWQQSKQADGNCNGQLLVLVGMIVNTCFFLCIYHQQCLFGDDFDSRHVPGCCHAGRVATPTAGLPNIFILSLPLLLQVHMYLVMFQVQ